MKIIYDKVPAPYIHQDYVPVELTEETMEEHRQKVLACMIAEKIDVLVVYADREHGANFAYLTGFEPRFEEALLVLYLDGQSLLLLGNENLKMGRYSYIGDQVIHVPHFSLPNQPMGPHKSMDDYLREAGILNGMNVGCAGWKVFTSVCENNDKLLDLPAFIVDALRRINPDGRIFHAGKVFQDVEKGVRIQANANEIAHFEFGAGLASARVLDVLDHIEPGITEIQLAGNLHAYGQPQTVTTICAGGERFANAIVFPRNRPIGLGELFSVTFGLRGGLSSRTAYVAKTVNDLPGHVQDYIETVAIPYYQAAVSWYEQVGIGMSCADIYRTIECVLPQEKYHWTLNPGHYTAAEEWVSSPFFKDSSVILQSGMMLQMDIIPSVAGYAGVGAEDGVAIADKNLRTEIQSKYPDVWNRIQNRREYMQQCLGITLKDEILPLSDICGYLRPLLLNHEYALRKGGE